MTWKYSPCPLYYALQHKVQKQFHYFTFALLKPLKILCNVVNITKIAQAEFNTYFIHDVNYVQYSKVLQMETNSEINWMCGRKKLIRLCYSKKLFIHW